MGHEKHLRAFVLRARRVESHSFLQDKKAVARWRRVNHSAERLEQLEQYVWKVEHTLRVPPEEQVESLAARVRPFLTKSDPVHHEKVMKALIHYAVEGHSDVDLLNDLESLSTTWSYIDPYDTSRSRQLRVITETADGTKVETTDNTLGFAWLFGDVVHADAKRRMAGRVAHIRDRFSMAVPIVIAIAEHAATTMRTVELMRNSGFLPDLTAEYEEDVVVDQESYSSVATQRYYWPGDENDPFGFMDDAASDEVNDEA